MNTYTHLRLRRIHLHPTLNRRLDQVVHRIEHLFLEVNGGYTSWGMMTEKERRRLRSHIKRTVRDTLLTNELKKALSLDCLGDDGIPNFETALFKHILKEWYNGQLRSLLVDLREARR